jgi:hypothetical protein
MGGSARADRGKAPLVRFPAHRLDPMDFGGPVDGEKVDHHRRHLKRTPRASVQVSHDDEQWNEPSRDRRILAPTDPIANPAR